MDSTSIQSLLLLSSVLWLTTVPVVPVAVARRKEKKINVKQYIYGNDGEIPVENGVAGKESVLVEVAQKALSQENIIEQEIRQQQEREKLMRVEGTVKHHNENKGDKKQESLIEREIRLQKEKEEKVLKEREEAKRMALSKGLSSPQIIITNGHTSRDSSPTLEPEYPVTAEARIAIEIRELKAREEELKRLRDLEEAPVSFSASVTTDEGNFSEFGQDDSSSSRLTSPEIPAATNHERTQSLDSVSSGHSSTGTQHYYADFVSKRKVTVRPLEEPEEEEETPAYKRVLGETAVEREIRLAREREQELRLMKQSSNSSLNVPAKKELTRRSSGGRLDPAPDARDIPHRLATHTIKREIWEQSEREHSMRKEGTILSTSEDHVDAKVTRLSDLVEMSKEQINEQTARKLSSSTSSTSSKPVHKPLTPTTSLHKSHKPAYRKSSAPTYLSNGYSQTTGRASSTVVPSTRGLMQKFIANRGKMPSMGTFNSGSATLPPKLSPVSPVVDTPVPLPTAPSRNFEKNKNASRTTRRYSRAEEKIHKELKDMKERENELKQNRKLAQARSQPDLVAAVAEEERVTDEEAEELSLPSVKPLRDRAMSNPNLLDDDEKQSARPFRRNPLIAKWESRIQQNNES